MSSGALRDVTGYLLVVLLASTLGPLQFGFHLAELNAPQDVITCEKKSIASTQTTLEKLASLVTSTPNSDAASTAAVGGLPDCIPMTPASFATISAIFTIGGLLGALTSGPFTSARGRWPAMQLTALFFLLGSITETFSSAVWVFCIGRFLAGIGAGASTVIVPLYISEVSPPEKRGFFGAFTQISINVGILFTQTLGYFLSHDAAWRWILGAGVIIAVTQSAGLFLAPESPTWTASTKGNITKARRVLQRIRGRDANIDEEVDAWGRGDGKLSAASEEEGLLASPTTGNGDSNAVAAPVASSSASQHSDTSSSSRTLGFTDVVKNELTRPAIVAVVGIMFAQQLCGINSIIMYSVSLFRDLLPASLPSAVLTILISVMNLVMTIAGSPLPDRLGRKSCLLLSIIGQGSSSLALALSILFEIKALSAVAALFFVAFFAVGLGPVPFIMASELVGPEAVGATQSWALGANYMATFLVAYLFPIVNEWLNNWLGGAGWVYFIFAGFALLFASFVGKSVPETKGRRNADEVWGRVRRID